MNSSYFCILLQYSTRILIVNYPVLFFSHFLVNMKVLMRLSALASDWWCYFSNGRQGLLDLVVRLLLNLENSIYHILTMLLDTASLSEPELLSVSMTAQEIIGNQDLRQFLKNLILKTNKNRII